MVGIMVHGFTKKGLSPYRLVGTPARAIKVHHKMFRIFSSLLACIVLFTSVPAGAFETTKASALVTEEMRAKTLSFTKKVPHKAQGGQKADPCLPLLQARRQSFGASKVGFQHRRPVGKTATPVALGLVLGIRVALGPKNVVTSSDRVQIGPEIRANRAGSDNYALAVAAYRSCKNKYTLSLLNKNNN